MTNPAASTDAMADLVIKALYDGIMAQIEPDLVSSAADTLESKYAQETVPEFAQRMERYQKAKALCDERVNAVIAEWQSGLLTYQDLSNLKVDTVPPPPPPLRA